MFANDLDQQKITAPALRYCGGKFRLASWIIQYFPAHHCYVEPFGGAASVLLKKPRSYAEVYNDLDGDIVNFFRVVRDAKQCRDLVRQLELTPYARDEFVQAFDDTDCLIERARRTAVRAQMAFGSSGATKSTTGFRSDTKRQNGTSIHNWQAYPSRMLSICQRLSGVLIENKPWQSIIKLHDSERTLFFVDPPYLHSTRQMGHTNGCYKHEMNDIDHLELLKTLNNIAGIAIICGYPSEMYADMLSNWHSVSKNAAASSYRGTKKTVEMLWLNPACVAALKK